MDAAAGNMEGIMDKLTKLEPMRYFLSTTDPIMIIAHNQLVEAFNALADVVQAQGEIIETLVQTAHSHAPTDPRQTHVTAGKRDANPS